VIGNGTSACSAKRPWHRTSSTHERRPRGGGAGVVGGEGGGITPRRDLIRGERLTASAVEADWPGTPPGQPFVFAGAQSEDFDGREGALAIFVVSRDGLWRQTYTEVVDLHDWLAGSKNDALFPQCPKDPGLPPRVSFNKSNKLISRGGSGGLFGFPLSRSLQPARVEGKARALCPNPANIFPSSGK